MKITKSEKFNMLLNIEEVAENDMLVEFINHELELIEKKSHSGSRKPNARQIENAEVLKPQIMDYLASVESATAGDIAKGIELDVTIPRVTAQLTQLLIDRKVVRVVEKGKPFYSIA